MVAVVGWLNDANKINPSILETTIWQPLKPNAYKKVSLDASSCHKTCATSCTTKRVIERKKRVKDIHSLICLKPRNRLKLFLQSSSLFPSKSSSLTDFVLDPNTNLTLLHVGTLY